VTYNAHCGITSVMLEDRSLNRASLEVPVPH
jgi:hypothetical protein